MFNSMHVNVDKVNTVKPRKFELPLFRNTCLFEINIGHTRFRDNRTYSCSILIIVYNNICFGCVKETSH